MTSIDISDEEIARILLIYSVSATYELCEAIRLYISVLLFWNQKMSLTAISDVREIVKFHFGESMFAASALKIAKGRLADVGSGAGFPGIPLKMIRPELEVTLIESSLKKAAFLSEISRKLALNIEVFKGRSDDFPQADPQFDFVISRAVGHLNELVSWSQKHLRPGGEAVFWGVKGENRKHDIVDNETGNSWRWSPEVEIPASQNRVLLIGTNYPRD